MDRPLGFGIFLAPFHAVTENPTLAIENDLELIQHLDRLGFDEAWFGEHHSAGYEIFSAPEFMVVAAAARTTRIRLGTGVNTLSLHHPFMVADRLVFLDHLTRGRFMMGIGPGSLASDAEMLGVEVSRQRQMMEEALDVIRELLRYEGPVTRKTDWFTLNEARLQLRPFQYPCFEMAVAAVGSPTGPRLAGRTGSGLLSIGATSEAGFEALADAWGIMEYESAQHGTTVSRKSWRLAGPMHIAPTEAQAREEVRYGLARFIEYCSDVASLKIFPPEMLGKGTVDDLVDVMNASGWAVIGTPEMARTQVQRLLERTGGFGTYLVFAHDWADREATFRSYELLARDVFPHFNGQVEARQAAMDSVRSRGAEFKARTASAQDKAREDYAAERGAAKDGKYSDALRR